MKNLIESESLEIPSELPAMTLPGVVFFPKAMMPLYIFEKRYRLMIEEILDSHRMFCVAALRESESDTAEEFEEAFNMAIEGCKQVYEVQRNALKNRYGGK